MALVGSLKPKFAKRAAKFEKAVTQIYCNIQLSQRTKVPHSEDQSFFDYLSDHNCKGFMAHSSPNFRFQTPGKCSRIATESLKYPSAGSNDAPSIHPLD